MGTVEMGETLHKLIDNADNPELLKSMIEFFHWQDQSKPGELWDSLTDRQRREVLIAFDESESDENLVPHSEVMKDSESRRFSGRKELRSDSKRYKKTLLQTSELLYP